GTRARSARIPGTGVAHADGTEMRRLQAVLAPASDRLELGPGGCRRSQDRAEATQPGEELRFAAAGAANRRMGDLRRWTAPGSAAEDRSRRRQHARDDCI